MHRLIAMLVPCLLGGCSSDGGGDGPGGSGETNVPACGGISPVSHLGFWVVPGETLPEAGWQTPQAAPELGACNASCVVTSVYTAAGDPYDGVVTEFVFDAKGEISQTALDYGQSTEGAVYDHDAVGQTILETRLENDVSIRGTAFSYDEHGTLVSREDATSTGYTTNLDTYANTYTSDDLLSGYVRTQEHPGPTGSIHDEVVTIERDERGRATAVLYDGSNEARFEYDDKDRLIRADYGVADELEFTFEYDAFNRMISLAYVSEWEGSWALTYAGRGGRLSHVDIVDDGQATAFDWTYACP
jgi:hypothetical protein